MDKEIISVFDWISGGLSVSALALFMFIAGIETELIRIKYYSILCFVVAMPLLLGAYILSKNSDLFYSNLKNVELIRGILLVLGGLVYFVGFTFLIWVVEPKAVTTFCAVVGITAVLISKALPYSSKSS